MRSSAGHARRSICSIVIACATRFATCGRRRCITAPACRTSPSPGTTRRSRWRPTSSRRTSPGRPTPRGCSLSRAIPGSATVYAPSPEPTQTGAIAASSPCAISKLAQEQLALRAIQEDGLDVIVTRSFNHTGRGRRRRLSRRAWPGRSRSSNRAPRAGHQGRQPRGAAGSDGRARRGSRLRGVDAPGTTGVVYNVASGLRLIQSILDAFVRAASTCASRGGPGALEAE